MVRWSQGCERVVVFPRPSLLRGYLSGTFTAAKLHSMAGHSSKILSFQLSNLQSDKDQPRLGRLSFNRRNPIDTPHYIAVTSRGAVPHLSQDMARDNTSIRAFYAAVEDCE